MAEHFRNQIQLRGIEYSPNDCLPEVSEILPQAPRGIVGEKVSKSHSLKHEHSRSRPDRVKCLRYGIAWGEVPWVWQPVAKPKIEQSQRGCQRSDRDRAHVRRDSCAGDGHGRGQIYMAV